MTCFPDILYYYYNTAAGVSLMFLGGTLPSDSIVDFDDILNIGSLPSPLNRNPASASASLQCITDLVDCCGNESGTVRTERGNCMVLS